MQLLSPLDCVALVQLMKARIVITDSWGFRKSLPASKSRLLLQERRQNVLKGAMQESSNLWVLSSSIVEAAVNLLESQQEREKMRSGLTPYGDGHAAARIGSAILDASNING